MHEGWRPARAGKRLARHPPLAGRRGSGATCARGASLSPPGGLSRQARSQGQTWTGIWAGGIGSAGRVGSVEGLMRRQVTERVKGPGSTS